MKFNAVTFPTDRIPELIGKYAGVTPGPWEVSHYSAHNPEDCYLTVEPTEAESGTTICDTMNRGYKIAGVERDMADEDGKWAAAADPETGYVAALNALRETQARLSEQAKAHIGTSAIIRDLVWCECGHGLSRYGLWIYCPKCGTRLDPESYAEVCELAQKNLATKFIGPEEQLENLRAESIAMQGRLDAVLVALKHSARIQVLWEEVSARPNDWTSAMDARLFDALDHLEAVDALAAAEGKI